MRYINIVFVIILLSGFSLNAKESFCKESGYLDFQNKENQTEETLAKIIKKNPKDMDCMIKLINIYLKEGKVDKGFELLVKANKIDPKYIKSKKIHQILEIALYMTDLKKRAIKNNDIKSWNILGATYYKMGVFSESIKAYTKSLNINPSQISPRLTLALDFSRTNQAYRAVKELNKVLRIDKDNFFAYYYTGKILMYQIKDTKKAKLYLKKAKKLCQEQKNRFGKDIYNQYMKDLENETEK